MASSFMHRIIPERPDRFMFHIRTTHTDVLQCFIAQTRQQLAFTMKFVPATKLVQQIRYHMG